MRVGFGGDLVGGIVVLCLLSGSVGEFLESLCWCEFWYLGVFGVMFVFLLSEMGASSPDVTSDKSHYVN